MRLFEAFGAPGYHTSVATTFDVDLEAYELVALTRLRDSGCINNILITDNRMLTHALDGRSKLPKQAGRSYSVVAARAGGLYHPKLLLQLGRTSGRLLVSSANMTAAGLAGNLEVIGEVVATAEDQIAAPVLRGALTYLARVLATDSRAVRKQIDWAMDRSPWLRNAPASLPMVDDEAGAVGFLAQDAGSGIGDRFVQLVGGKAVKRLIVMSPYWDDDLSAAKLLRERLRPRGTALLVQPETALFPKHAFGRMSDTKLYDVARIANMGKGRFAHAKVFIAQTADADHVLYGSANCTKAALGTSSYAGANEEACLYRRLPAGAAVKSLGLEAVLQQDAALSLSKIPAFVKGEEIPLKEADLRSAGRFELRGDVLIWTPSKQFDRADVTINLLDNTAKRLECRLEPVGKEGEVREYRLFAKAAPSFARVRFEAVESALAIVLVEQALRDCRRPPVRTPVRDVLDMLEDVHACEGLWMVEAVTAIARAEADRQKSDGETPPQGRAPRTAPSNGEKPQGRRLSYEEFIKGREPHEQEAPVVGESGLASSHTDAIRVFINALIGVGEKSLAVELLDNDVPTDIFNMGDETPDGARSLEDGEDLPDKLRKGEDKAELVERKRVRRRQQYVKDTQSSICKAVEKYVKRLGEESRSRSYDVVDLLRLRALLMVVLSAGSKRTFLLPQDSTTPIPRMQVLPSVGGDGWRRLAGQLLYATFKDDGILSRLELDVTPRDPLPVDVLEFWATCCWAVCALQCASNEHGVSLQVEANTSRRAREVYQLSGLLGAELAGERVIEIFSGLNRRYGERLGLDTAALQARHEEAVRAAAHSAHKTTTLVA